MDNSKLNHITPMQRFKVHKRFTPVVFAFYMSAIMAMLMCTVIVGVNTGVRDGYIARVLGTYILAMPVAFICVMLVRPVVVRLVTASVRA